MCISSSALSDEIFNAGLDWMKELLDGGLVKIWDE